MIIEALVRWTEIKSSKADDFDIDKEEKPSLSISYDYSPMTFDLRDVRRFNRANDPAFTTIRFNDGETNVIKYPYNSFVKMYSELTGAMINSIVPPEYLDSIELDGDEDDDEDYNGDMDGNDDFKDI